MSNNKRLSLISLCVICLTACGGSGSDSQNSQSVDLQTEEALADPDATFKMDQNIKYTASNQSDVNVTLFVYDNIQNKNIVARHYVKPAQSVEVEIQIPLAEQEVYMSWHYLEHVKEDTAEIAGLVSISFTGFD